MPKVFSRRTLEEFEAASASIPLRQLDRAFEKAQIRPSEDPGGLVGARRVQFRRYVASVDQHNPQQFARLGAALGALIEEVAVSKQGFLVQAAERDGLLFANGVFVPAGTDPRSFVLTRVEDFASLEERGRRLHLLANERPTEAIGGAKEVLESVCRIILSLIGKPVPASTAGLADIVKATLGGLDLIPAALDDPNKSTASVREYIQQLGAGVARLGELERYGSAQGENGQELSPRHARLAVGAAVSFAEFVAQIYTDWDATKTAHGANDNGSRKAVKAMPKPVRNGERRR